MNTLVVRVTALLAGALVAGCGGPLAEDTTPRGNVAGAPQARAQRTTPKRDANYEDENSVGMSQERVNKWRWQGDRKECYFVTGNKCFVTAKQACKAARCGKRGCEIDDEGAPARVMCEGDDAGARAIAERDAIKARNKKAEGEFDDSRFRKKKKKRKFVPKEPPPAADDGDDDDDRPRKKKRGRRGKKKRGKRR